MNTCGGQLALVLKLTLTQPSETPFSWLSFGLPGSVWLISSLASCHQMQTSSCDPCFSSFLCSVLGDFCHLGIAQCWWVLLSTWEPSLMDVFLLPHIHYRKDHTHLLTHTACFLTFHSFPSSLESPFTPSFSGCQLFPGESFLIISKIYSCFLLLPPPLPGSYHHTFSTSTTCVRYSGWTIPPTVHEASFFSVSLLKGL